MNILADWEKDWFQEMSRAFMGSEVDRKWLRSSWRQAGQMHSITGIGRPRKNFDVELFSEQTRSAGTPTIHPKMKPDARNTHRKAMYRACKIVERAVKAGNLINLKRKKILCVDCRTNRATKYEHRDYAKPLEVDPVCQRCNQKRGPAILSAPVPTRNLAAA